MLSSFSNWLLLIRHASKDARDHKIEINFESMSHTERQRIKEIQPSLFSDLVHFFRFKRLFLHSFKEVFVFNVLHTESLQKSSACIGGSKYS